MNYAYSYSTTTLVFEIYQISHSMVPNQKIKDTLRANPHKNQTKSNFFGKA